MIWLIGNKGMLGTELAECLSRRGLSHVVSDRDVSILDQKALSAFADAHGPNWIVNCAAYTAVDKAESEADLAQRLNSEGPENIGSLAATINARVLHISTDYVFSGSASVPYREEDPVAPQGVYGATKAEGEARLLAVAPNSIILRTAWLYGRYGPNFVYTMLKLMGTKDEIGVVADQRGSPTWAADLAQGILSVLTATRAPAGIYHYTNSGDTTWHEFALAIQEEGLARGILTRKCGVKALTTDQYPTKAKRPAYSILSKAKIEAVFGIRPPEWKESLKAFFDSGLTL